MLKLLQLIYLYKNKWTKETKKNDLIKPRKFRNIFRFIDDLYYINDGGEFETNFCDIYPEI